MEHKQYESWHLLKMIKFTFKDVSTKNSEPIHVNLWELLGGDLPPTNSSKGEILCVAFKCTKLYLVDAYM